MRTTRKILMVSTAVGMALLSGCSAASSATHASLASIPASLAPQGSSITEESFTGTGARTEANIDLRGNKVRVYITCITTSSEHLPDPAHGGVRVSVGSKELGSSGCSDDDQKSNGIVTIYTPLSTPINGTVKIEAAKDTRWRVTVADGLGS